MVIKILVEVETGDIHAVEPPQFVIIETLFGDRAADFYFASAGAPLLLSLSGAATAEPQTLHPLEKALSS